MIVIDASTMVEALVVRQVDDELLDALREDIHAPHLLDVKALSVLRGLTLSGKLMPRDAQVRVFARAIDRQLGGSSRYTSMSSANIAP
jgi:predicted nucleic acid-binding protein